MSSILLLHFIGLLYTSDFNYAFKDIRIKMPLLVLPLVISTTPPLELRKKHLVLKFLVASVFLSSVISSLVLTDIIHREITDVRYASIFISHVRMALLVCVSVFICVWFFRHPAERKWRFLYLALIVWFFIFIILIESITGLSVLIIVFIVFCLKEALKTERIGLRIFKVSAVILIIAGMSFFIYSTYKRYSKIDKVDITKLEKFTAKGNPYQHESLINAPTENGHYVWIYYSEKELKEEWSKRSKLDYNWKDLRGNVLRYTLIRYMTSRNLRKDAEGFSHLTDDEIRNIEKGIANVDYMSSLKGRISEIIWEIMLYNNTGDANGHSITQRFEYWKAASGIISGHPVFGVGTGDIQKAFDQQYETSKTNLKKEWRLRSHNQYLSITVAFGFLGLIWFLCALIYPALKLNGYSEFLYLTFFIVAVVSFITEDTLETQVGVTFFAFLNTFLLFNKSEKE
ncbi:MAG: Lipid core - O-antigen ligase [Bacteroidetes bacterium]|nr:Lipid core - O-antigen ligase [Bacteroidota bacterium]